MVTWHFYENTGCIKRSFLASRGELISLLSTVLDFSSRPLQTLSEKYLERSTGRCQNSLCSWKANQKVGIFLGLWHPTFPHCVDEGIHSVPELSRKLKSANGVKSKSPERPMAVRTDPPQHPSNSRSRVRCLLEGSRWAGREKPGQCLAPS